jgi:hypothetical protein
MTAAVVASTTSHECRAICELCFEVIRPTSPEGTKGDGGS